MERPFEIKQLQSYPDDFDIIKVITTGTSATGRVIRAGTIFILVAKGTPSGFTALTAGATIYTATQNYTMKAGDNVTLLGYEQNYTAIMVMNQPTFANDETSVIIAGAGKNLSHLNTLTNQFTILGFFQRIQIPATSTTMIVIAYK
jgi:hypothetical protein